MQRTNFVALTGHLDDYPLADLIGMLRRQGKSGRLLVEYPAGPCSFYFDDGRLVDAQLNSVGGLQAVLLALSQPNAPFNFNPLVSPRRRSIDDRSEKVVFELLGCCDEKIIDVEAQQAKERTDSGGPREDGTAAHAERASFSPVREALALPPASPERASRRGHTRMLVASAAISLVVSLGTVAALASWLIKREISAALMELERNGRTSAPRGEMTDATAQTVKVVVEVDHGRVSQAFVESPRPGQEASEALALKIARQRRYSPGVAGQDTVLVKINATK